MNKSNNYESMNNEVKKENDSNQTMLSKEDLTNEQKLEYLCSLIKKVDKSLEILELKKNLK